MGSGSKVRLELGVAIEKELLARGGRREDIALVLKQDPRFVASVGARLFECARAIKSNFRFVNEEVVIQLPALKRPILTELQASFPQIIKIERDDSAEGPITLRIATVLVSNELSIDGQMYERRLLKLRSEGRLLGLQHLLWLLEHQQEHPAFMALLGAIYVDFPGIIVVARGGRFIPFVGQCGQRWGDNWNRVDEGFTSGGRVAIAA